MANCEAHTRYGCNKTTVLGSIMLCGGGRGGGLISTKAVASASCTLVDMVPLDPAITESCKN